MARAADLGTPVQVDSPFRVFGLPAHRVARIGANETLARNLVDILPHRSTRSVAY
jgi:hypothetical protein